MFGRCFYKCIVQFLRFFYFAGRNFQYVRNTTFGFPLLHFHFQNIYHCIKLRSGGDRILNLNYFIAKIFF